MHRQLKKYANSGGGGAAESAAPADPTSAAPPLDLPKLAALLQNTEFAPAVALREKRVTWWGKFWLRICGWQEYASPHGNEPGYCIRRKIWWRPRRDDTREYIVSNWEFSLCANGQTVTCQMPTQIATLVCEAFVSANTRTRFSDLGGGWDPNDQLK